MLAPTATAGSAREKMLWSGSPGPHSDMESCDLLAKSCPRSHQRSSSVVHQGEPFQTRTPGSSLNLGFCVPVPLGAPPPKFRVVPSRPLRRRLHQLQEGQHCTGGVLACVMVIAVAQELRPANRAEMRVRGKVLGEHGES